MNTQTIDKLNRILSDETRPLESRKAAAEHILTLRNTSDAIATQTEQAPNAPPNAEILTENQIADDDPDVLVLTKPIGHEPSPGEVRFCGPKSLHNAKAIVAGRRRRVVELDRVVDENLSESERLAAIGAILSTLKVLAPLDMLEEVTWDRIGGRSAEWLLANANTANQTPISTKDAWPLILLPHHW